VNNNNNYNIRDYHDPFDVDKFTRLIHFTNQEGGGFTPTEKAALLARYSRSTKSMVDLIESGFTNNKDRGPTFINKLLSEFGDDSVAELDSQQVGIEGLSLLAASKLTDRRIGISFLEKSTRYVPFSADSFYIPSEIFEMGLVDDYKNLCALSYKTFQFIYNDLLSLLKEQYPIESYYFYDSITKKEVPFESLSLEYDLSMAEKAYQRSLKDKAFDNAGYAWLLSLKTNIGFNGNSRAIEYLLKNCKVSPLSELRELEFNLYNLLSENIEPFIKRAKNPEHQIINTNPFSIYSPSNGDSIISVYKHNIVNLLRTYDHFHTDLDNIDPMMMDENPKIPKNMKQNTNLVKNLLTEIGLAKNDGTKIHLKDVKTGNDMPTRIDLENFRPVVDIVSFMNEQFCIDQLCSAIIYENNENLLYYDDKNSNNIDENLRILPANLTNIKAGVLYDIINNNRVLEDFGYIDTRVNKTTENTLSFNDISSYWQENAGLEDNPVHQDYLDKKKLSLTQDQSYIIKKYIGERRNRRDKLGRAFEFIDYTIELSSSFRIMREFKRHRLLNLLSQKVITARNSYASFIFPDIFLKNQHLFNEYKYLLEQSFTLYDKIIKKSNDYHTAQYVLPAGVRTNYVFKINFRELDHLLSLRTTPQSHEEFRHICQGIYNLLMIIHPNLIKQLEFVDLNEYSLGRLKSEYNKENKLKNVIGEV
jgi:thymidylate synthase ThyX